jgi:hypothetical protein
VLHVEVNRTAGDPLRLGDTISYLTSEVRPAVERQRGSLGMSPFIDPATGAMGFEAFWASHGALVASEEVIAASVPEAARRTEGTVTRERYEVLVFEREAPWRGGQGVRVTRMTVEPSKAEDTVAPMSAESARLSKVEDAVALYGETAVPVLADTSGFCAALLYADWAAGPLISETQDPHALAASRSAATAGEAAAAEAVHGVIGASAEYRLVFSSARAA